jgi:hypothetical protein
MKRQRDSQNHKVDDSKQLFRLIHSAYLVHEGTRSPSRPQPLNTGSDASSAVRETEVEAGKKSS